MADISQIVLLDESVYDLKDAVARGLLNGHSVGIDVPSNAKFTDTKTTAGSTDTSSKIFLIGATSQATNPQTYSHDTAYVGTDGCLYSGGTKVLTSHQSLSGKLDTSLKGAANGLAELDANGKVPSTQLPSYVDDVLEYSAKSSFPATGETGKIYVDTTTNLTYRWSGSAYVEISASLALGTTSSTAFRGDYGNSAYAHAVTNKGSAFSSGLYKITTNSEGHVTAATAVAKADITGLGIPGTDTNTHRPIQVNGTEVLGNNTTALNLKAGSNVSVTNSSGTVTIAATDTTYSSKAAASGGTDVSLVTTGEKYTWNSKTSNTGTVTKVSTGVGLTGGDITGSGTVKAKLKSETASTLDSAAMGSTASRQYAVGVDKSGYLSVNIPWSNTTYSANTSKLVTTTVPNVTAAGSVPSLSYTARSVGSASGWSAGSVPTLGTAIPADDITAWTTNTPTSFSVSGEKLTITSGTAASLSYTAKSIPNVTSVGTAPSLTITTVACDDITAWNAGSAPTLGTAITVATGSLSSSGGGGTVATGITAS